MHQPKLLPTSGAFVAVSWAGLLLGSGGFLIGLWNATTLALSEKGFYFAVMLLGLYAAVSLQKTVRDRMEGLPASGLYFGMSWAAVGGSVLLLTVGLFNAQMALSEKGFYAMAYGMAMMAAIAVQKNVRDAQAWDALAVDKPFAQSEDEGDA